MRRVLILSVLMCLTACQPGAQPQDLQAFFKALEPPPQAGNDASLLDKAKIAELGGDYAQAAALYQKAALSQPANQEIRLLLADAYRRADEIEPALAIYGAILATNPGHIDAVEGKALALMAKGDFNTPTNLFDQVMKADPTRWKTLNGLGILFSTRNMHNEAGQYFQAALNSSPSNPSVINNLALSQALSKQYDAAIAHFAEASSLTVPDSLERRRIEMNLALLYASMGRLDDARDLTARYYSGQALENNIGIYAHLANDKQLADTYIYMALTENRSFYERALSRMQASAQSASALSNLSPASGGDAPYFSILNDPTVGAVPTTPPVTESVASSETALTPIPKNAATAAPAFKPSTAGKVKSKPKTVKHSKPEADKKPKPVAVKREEARPPVKEPSRPLVIHVEPPSQPVAAVKPATPEDKSLANIIGAVD